MNKDARGVTRGRCTACSDCSGYEGGEKGMKCIVCSHVPVKHVDMTSGGSAPVVRDHLVKAPDPSPIGPSPAPPMLVKFPEPKGASPLPQRQRGPKPLRPRKKSSSPAQRHRKTCLVPGCSEDAFVDLNTGCSYVVCHDHKDSEEHLTNTLSGTHIIQDGTSVDPPTQTAPVVAFSVQPKSAVVSPSTDDDDEDQQPPYSPFQALLFGRRHPQRAPRPDTAAVGRATRRAPVAPSTGPMLASPSAPNLSTPAQPPVPPDQQCKLPGCTKKKYVEKNGRVHDCCGRTHAQQFAASAVPPGMQCATPGCPRQKRQKDDGSGYFDYCSMSCCNSGQSGLVPSASTPTLATTPENTCVLPGCNMAKYVDPANSHVHDYCCRSHAYEARIQGTVVTKDTITITAVSGREFQSVSVRFTRAWAKGQCPTLSFAFEIKNTSLQQRWTVYQKQLGDRTVEEHYHGTKLTCNITVTQTLCNDTNCGICGITNSGLDRRCIQKNINFQRFGHGFYLAPNSSKCHDYTQGAHNYRAMLLCDVLPGKKHFLTKDDTKLTNPPPGHDSVYGQAGSGSCLNYEEIVVYNPDSAMPRYVCVYQKDGVGKIAS